MNRGRPHALGFDVASGGDRALAKADAKTGSDALQRVPRGDLCLPAPVGESGASLSEEALGQRSLGDRSLEDWPLGHRISGRGHGREGPERDVPGRGALGLEHVEPRAVYRLKGQHGLKPFDAGRIQCPGGLQGSIERALPLKVRPIALEAQRAKPGGGGVTNSPVAASRSIHNVTAGRTEGLRSFAFQFPTREAHPLVSNRLSGYVAHENQSSGAP